MAYREAVSRGADTDIRQLNNLIVHGEENDKGELIGIYFEKTFVSPHHPPVLINFPADQGFEAVAYFAACLGMDETGRIGAVPRYSDDEEDGGEESGGDESEQPEGGEDY